MEIWLLIAALSALTVVLLASGAGRTGQRARQSHVLFYAREIDELDRALGNGSIAVDDAAAQKTEMARRLLAATSSEERNAAGLGAVSRWFVAMLVPLLALGIYSRYGAPMLPDLPQAERLANAEANGDLEAMVYRVERHLSTKPDDAPGWKLLQPIYHSLGRFENEATAFQALIRLEGPNAEYQAGLAEALTMANGGLLTREAAEAANAALRLEPKNPKARYFAALGLAQEGKTEAARAGFESLLAESAADAPWRAAVTRELAELQKPASAVPAPSAEAAKTVLEQSDEDQKTMIRGMVDGLAAKLAANPDNLPGWLQLIRARTVLAENDAARSALAEARKTFSGDGAALAKLDALAAELALP